MMGQGFGKKKGALAKTKQPAPEEDEDEMESGEPTASDSPDNKKARRAIFLKKIMGGKSK